MHRTWFVPLSNDVAKGERCEKDVYEALRAGPKWNNTMLLIVYDDAGGFYDQVIPPYSSPEVPEAVPDDEAPCQAPCRSFDFRRLGLRTTGMLLSPWVKKGAIFQEPQAPFGSEGRSPTNTSQFELTSVAASVKHLFNLSMFLTKRDACEPPRSCCPAAVMLPPAAVMLRRRPCPPGPAALLRSAPCARPCSGAGNFEELLEDAPRPESDMPMHLPDAPPPKKPWSAPPAALPKPYPDSAIPPLKPPQPSSDTTTTFTTTSSSGGGGGEHAAAAAGAARWRRTMEEHAAAHDAGQVVPQHCSAKGATCEGLRRLNVRQRRHISLYSKLTMSAEPDYDEMTFVQGEEWLSSLWRTWRAQGTPLR
jgi:hypothetical protein